MKKVKRKFIHYFDECWEVNFYFCFGWTIEEFALFIKKKTGNGSNLSDCAGQCVYNSEVGTFIFIKEKCRTIKFYSSLVHEITHAAVYNLTDKGVKIEYGNDEPLAYLTGCLMKKALE